MIDARAIPGTELVMAVLGSCHDRPWGALAIIDVRRRRGRPARRSSAPGRPTRSTWCATPARPMTPGTRSRPCEPKYEDPYPLSDKYFLCSRMTGNGEQMGIYLLDIFGNEVLLHADEPAGLLTTPCRSAARRARR